MATLRLVLARLLVQGYPPRLAAAAAQMNCSRRTLQRRLRENGASFQQELADVRRILARRLLHNTVLDPVAIAMLLGFSEPNSFTRHLHSHEGMSPLQWRAAHTEPRS